MDFYLFDFVIAFRFRCFQTVFYILPLLLGNTAMVRRRVCSKIKEYYAPNDC